MKKSFTPPRLLILDNDETTGSYLILFYLYDLFAESEFGLKLDPAITLTVLAAYFQAMNIFRPGLDTFLKSVATLKSSGRLDSIVMYTNQLDVRHTIDTSIWKPKGHQWNVPMMIHVMLVYLADYPKLIDEILTRPIGSGLLAYPVKDFVRAYRSIITTGPVNLEKTLFIDDLASEPYLVDSSHSATDKNSRIHVAPYSRKLLDGSFRLIIKAVLSVNKIEASKTDLDLIDAFEQKWLRANGKIVDKNLDTRMDDLLPVLKSVFTNN